MPGIDPGIQASVNVKNYTETKWRDFFTRA